MATILSKRGREALRSHEEPSAVDSSPCVCLLRSKSSLPMAKIAHLCVSMNYKHGDARGSQSPLLVGDG